MCEKKKFMCEKKEKKKGAENLLGYCPTVSQYSGELYCETAGNECAVVGKIVLQ